MGTTLHAHIEVKKNGQWMHFGAPSVERDYRLFAAISGERLDEENPMPWMKGIEPLASVKSLPEDISYVTSFCYEQDKNKYRIHGEGALLAEDIKNLQDHLCKLVIISGDEEWANSCDLEIDIFHTFINDGSIALHRGWDDVRIVFWYDN